MTKIKSIMNKFIFRNALLCNGGIEQINGRERGQRASYQTSSVKSESRVAAHATLSQPFDIYLLTNVKNLFSKTTLSTLLLVLCAISSFSQKVKSSEATQTSNSEVSTVSYCDLINNDEKYNGKTIRVEVIYVTFFEKSVIFNPECKEGNTREYQTWIDFSDGLSDVKSQRHMIKRINKFQKKLNERLGGGAARVVFVGKFQGSGYYGHQGGYRYRMEVDSIELVESVSEKASR